MKYKSLKSCLKKSPVAFEIDICDDPPEELNYESKCPEPPKQCKPKCSEPMKSYQPRNCEPMKCNEPKKCVPNKCCEPNKCCKPSKCEPINCCETNNCCKSNECCEPTKCGYDSMRYRQPGNCNPMMYCEPRCYSPMRYGEPMNCKGMNHCESNNCVSLRCCDQKNCDSGKCCKPKNCEPTKCCKANNCELTKSYEPKNSKLNKCESDSSGESKDVCDSCGCEKSSCECPCESACLKPGCSQRMPCLNCIKKGVKVQIPISNIKCKKQCVNFNECPKPSNDCPKKVVIKSRCEIKRDDCQEDTETDCCCKKCSKCKQKSCKEDSCDKIDCCITTKNEGSNCKTSCPKKFNSCKIVKQCQCMSCKSIRCNENKCEKSCSNDNDDEKCCESSSKATRNSCKTSKQEQECPSKNSSCISSDCPKRCDNFPENYCNGEVDEKCTVYEQGDCMSYIPIPDANYCGPQKMSPIPPTCLPSVGSFCVPHISKQTPMPCPCGSRTCGNSVLIFQQAIQSPPCITAKRFL